MQDSESLARLLRHLPRPAAVVSSPNFAVSHRCKFINARKLTRSIYKRRLRMYPTLNRRYPGIFCENHFLPDRRLHNSAYCVFLTLRLSERSVVHQVPVEAVRLQRALPRQMLGVREQSQVFRGRVFDLAAEFQRGGLHFVLEPQQLLKFLRT